MVKLFLKVECINKCLEYLHEGASTFLSISDEKILAEVLNHDKGVKYLTRMYYYIFYIVNLKLNDLF